MGGGETPAPQTLSPSRIRFSNGDQVLTLPFGDFDNPFGDGWQYIEIGYALSTLQQVLGTEDTNQIQSRLAAFYSDNVLQKTHVQFDDCYTDEDFVYLYLIPNTEPPENDMTVQLNEELPFLGWRFSSQPA